MEDKFLDLKYIQAKRYLVSYINDLNKKNGLSYILIESILDDIHRQVLQFAKSEEEFKMKDFIDSLRNSENNLDEDKEKDGTF